MALEMNTDHGIPVFGTQAGEHAIPADTGIVNHYVQVSIGINCCLYDLPGLFVIGDIPAAGDSMAAISGNLVYSELRGLLVDVIDHDISPGLSQCFCITFAQAITRAGDHSGSVFT